MRNRQWIPVLISALVGSLCSANDSYEIKVYPCPRSDAPITVDGKLDESAWKKAPLVGGFTQYNKPVMVKPQTFFRVLYTDTHLVFGVTCDEPLMKKLVPVAQARDAHAVFSTEAVELFVDPKHDHGNYYQFAVNAAASMYDSFKTEPTWSGDIEAKTTLQKDHWTLEFAIPWKDLRVQPKPGMVLGINLCRDRLLGNSKLWCNWSQTKANFHDPERFGHLVLSPKPAQIGSLGEELRKGGRTGPIVIYSAEGSSQSSYRALADASLKKLDGLLTELRATQKREANARAQEELGKLIAKYESELKPLRKALAGKEALDAAEWTRLDLRANQIMKELDDSIWQARLNALLSEI